MIYYTTAQYHSVLRIARNKKSQESLALKQYGIFLKSPGSEFGSSGLYDTI